MSVTTHTYGDDATNADCNAATYQRHPDGKKGERANFEGDRSNFEGDRSNSRGDREKNERARDLSVGFAIKS